MTLLGWVILAVGSVLVAVVAQLLMRTGFPYRWIVTAVATFVGALGTSEWLFAGTTPEIEGIAVVPAIVGGLVVGIIVDLVAQWYIRREIPGGQGHGSPVR